MPTADPAAAADQSNLMEAIGMTRAIPGMASAARRPVRLAFAAAMALLTACVDQGEQAPDPFVEDFGIAYVRRAAPPPDDEADVREQLGFEPGADLYYRDLASPSAEEHNITGALTAGLGDVRDLDVSHDGSRLIFSMRLPDPDPTDDIEPTWNIWEYEIATGALRRVIESDITAEAGHDLGPAYLPDGRIVFSSTRQRTTRAMLLDEGKPQYAGLTENLREPALLLHVMNADGSEIRQVTFNQSHDLDPTVTRDGRVVFTRWNNMGRVDRMHLYRMAPDGTELELLYGARSHDTGSDGSRIEFLQPREMPDGRLLVLLRPYTGTERGGDLAVIDVRNYVENTQPTAINRNVLSGPAQAAATINRVSTEPGISTGGRFSAAWPLWDGTDRLLVSWSQCRLLEGDRIVPCTADRLADPDARPAPPVYGIYIYDRQQQTQLPIVKPEEGMMYTEVVAARPRTLPEIIFDKTGGVELDQQLVDEGVGVLHIRSVYDFAGRFSPMGGRWGSIEALADPALTTADQRPARFLRIVKAVSIPERDVLRVPGTAFGRSTRELMREIVGYVPIQPDGSARFKVTDSLLMFRCTWWAARS
jgi:Tol biopolymer transport system component